jgi:hypothetical protein
MKPKLLLLALVVAAVLGSIAVAMTDPRQGYAPQQPIYFRHSRMAAEPNWTTDEDGNPVNLGGYAIPCRYCHTMPYKGRHSTLPSTDICMNCHEVVGQNKEWVLELKKYWDRGEPVPWVKVHDLPDFAYYDHSAHLNVRNDKGELKLDCVDCHMDVENHDVVAVRTAFNMGWCIDCHRKPDMNASIDCVICHR